MSDTAEKQQSRGFIPAGNPMNLTCTIAPNAAKGNGNGPVYAIVINSNGDPQPPNDGAKWHEINGFTRPAVEYVNASNDGGNYSSEIPAGGIAIYHKEGT